MSGNNGSLMSRLNSLFDDDPPPITSSHISETPPLQATQFDSVFNSIPGHIDSSPQMNNFSNDFFSLTNTPSTIDTPALDISSSTRKPLSSLFDDDFDDLIGSNIDNTPSNSQQNDYNTIVDGINHPTSQNDTTSTKTNPNSKVSSKFSGLFDDSDAFDIAPAYDHRSPQSSIEAILAQTAPIPELPKPHATPPPPKTDIPDYIATLLSLTGADSTPPEPADDPPAQRTTSLFADDMLLSFDSPQPASSKLTAQSLFSSDDDDDASEPPQHSTPEPAHNEPASDHLSFLIDFTTPPKPTSPAKPLIEDIDFDFTSPTAHSSGSDDDFDFLFGENKLEKQSLNKSSPKSDKPTVAEKQPPRVDAAQKPHTKSDKRPHEPESKPPPEIEQPASVEPSVLMNQSMLTPKPTLLERLQAMAQIENENETASPHEIVPYAKTPELSVEEETHAKLAAMFNDDYDSDGPEPEAAPPPRPKPMFDDEVPELAKRSDSKKKPAISFDDDEPQPLKRASLGESKQAPSRKKALSALLDDDDDLSIPSSTKAPAFDEDEKPAPRPTGRPDSTKRRPREDAPQPAAKPPPLLYDDEKPKATRPKKLLLDDQEPPPKSNKRNVLMSDDDEPPKTKPTKRNALLNDDEPAPKTKPNKRNVLMSDDDEPPPQKTKPSKRNALLNDDDDLPPRPKSTKRNVLLSDDDELPKSHAKQPDRSKKGKSTISLDDGDDLISKPKPKKSRLLDDEDETPAFFVVRKKTPPPEKDDSPPPPSKSVMVPVDEDDDILGMMKPKAAAEEKKPARKVRNSSDDEPFIPPKNEQIVPTAARKPNPNEAIFKSAETLQYALATTQFDIDQPPMPRRLRVQLTLDGHSTPITPLFPLDHTLFDGQPSSGRVTIKIKQAKRPRKDKKSKKMPSGSIFNL